MTKTARQETSASCRHFPQCSGCDLLDLDYASQARQKLQYIKERFKSFRSCKINPVVESPAPYYYRHKAQLPFGRATGEGRRQRQGKKTRVAGGGIHLPISLPTKTNYFGKNFSSITLGLHSKDYSHVIDQQECLVQDEAITTVIKTVKHWAQKHRLEPYDERKNQGLLRHIVVKKALHSGEILVGLVTRQENFSSSHKLFQLLKDDIETSLSSFDPKSFTESKDLPAQEKKLRLTGIIQVINERNTKVVMTHRQKLIWGRPYLNEKIADLNFRVGLDTFFQVNPYQIENLYNLVLEHIDSGALVIDAYCGMGTIAQFIASKAQFVYGLEENKNSIQKAVDSTRANNITNVRYKAGPVAQNIGVFLEEKIDTVVLDPPREGLDPKTLQVLKAPPKNSKLKKIIYVSCDPQTLYRDALALQERYQLKSLTPVDLFSHTKHIESVAVFTS